MEMIKRPWWSAMFTVLFAAALPVHVSTYKVLMIPLFAKSHIFAMAALADGLADRGHKVTFFVGEHFQFNLPQLNRAEISVVRYRDSTDGAKVDYDARTENSSMLLIESDRSTKQQLDSLFTGTYVMYSGIMLGYCWCCATNQPCSQQLFCSDASRRGRM